MTGEREETFTFDGPGNRGLPQVLGQLTILPKAWWEGTRQARQEARRGRDHAGAAARLGPSTASKSSPPGRSIVYERVKGYWGLAQDFEDRSLWLRLPELKWLVNGRADYPPTDRLVNARRVQICNQRGDS
jgi:hypothetical protein